MIKNHLPKKRFGQNFLSDAVLLDKLANYINASKDDFFLEIGPGIGGLTNYLYKKPRRYVAVELDKDLIDNLESKFSNESNFKIINKDILDIDLKEFADVSNPIRLIGNLPYNLSSPILEWCFDQIEMIKDMHFMFQKEFAERCAGDETTNSYGKLSVMCKYLCKVEILSEVERNFFEPIPRVDSSFVRFIPKIRENKIEELKNLKKILPKLFNKKRKKVAKTLREIYSDKDLNEIDLDLNLRPDQMNIQQFIDLARLKQKNG
ncbi:MAG: 16S rRNA (adenine(1518)-N(6)/adenine(1519)-N(6))-dimethyltransferase RsmA [Gammaproteobacteria bacterium]